jgi:hypothetical protein
MGRSANRASTSVAAIMTAAVLDAETANATEQALTDGVATTPSADAMLSLDEQVRRRADNQQPMREAAISGARAMGEQAAVGVVSLLDMALAFTQHVREQLFTAGDASTIYLAYVAGYNATMQARAIPGELLPADEKGAAPSISMFKTFGLEFAVKAGVGFHARVVEVRSRLGVKERKSL